MQDIVVVGSINMDLVVKTQRLPGPGETIQGSDLQWIPGGKGANQAVAASRLGASVSMVGRVGNDLLGERLRADLIGQGVLVEWVKRDEQAASGTALIVVDASGENSIVISPGANGRITPTDVDLAEGLISRAKVVLLQLEIPLQVVEHTIRLAARHGVMTILNPAPAGKIPPQVYSDVAILVPNENELAALTGRRVKGMDSVKVAAHQLLETGLQAVVVTLGKRGACLVTREDAAIVPAFPIQAVDTTAAGDAFIAGLAVALLKAEGLVPAVRYGNACGALAAMRFGAQPSLPSAEQVKALIDSG